jgi:hypothetical protein
MNPRQTFSADQIRQVTEAVAMAEELVSNFYKLSDNQWLHARYDVRTLADLAPDEIVDGPFAQIIRYEAQRSDTSLGSSSYDFYKICIQDHAILAAMKKSPDLRLFPFALYIGTHELIHIVRFSKFLQNFNAPPADRMAEENRVHGLTRKILASFSTAGLDRVLEFYRRWQPAFEGLQNPA